jgi:hypothetical protein
VIATDEFEALAVEAARSQGLPDARMVTVAHPIGGVSDEGLRARAETAVDAVLGVLTGSKRDTGDG